MYAKFKQDIHVHNYINVKKERKKVDNSEV